MRQREYQKVSSQGVHNKGPAGQLEGPRVGRCKKCMASRMAVDHRAQQSQRRAQQSRQLQKVHSKLGSSQASDSMASRTAVGRSEGEQQKRRAREALSGDSVSYLQPDPSVGEGEQGGGQSSAVGRGHGWRSSLRRRVPPNQGGAVRCHAARSANWVNISTWSGGVDGEGAMRAPTGCS